MPHQKYEILNKILSPKVTVWHPVVLWTETSSLKQNVVKMATFGAANDETFFYQNDIIALSLMVLHDQQ